MAAKIFAAVTMAAIVSTLLIVLAKLLVIKSRVSGLATTHF